MPKYAPLGDFLRGQQADLVPMTFAQIERIIGSELPPSARKHRPWWSNNPHNSVLTKVWLDAGYASEQVDMESRKLIFRRVRKSAPLAQNHAKEPKHPLFGALKGLLRIANGADLTKPADPDWGAR